MGNSRRNVCVYKVESLAYFAIYRFDVYWKFVARKVHLSAEVSVRVPKPSRLYFACSRLWVSNFSNKWSKNVAEFERVYYIESGGDSLRELHLEPLPKAFDDLEAWTSCSNDRKEANICALQKKIHSTFSWLFSDAT